MLIYFLKYDLFINIVINVLFGRVQCSLADVSEAMAWGLRRDGRSLNLVTHQALFDKPAGFHAGHKSRQEFASACGCAAGLPHRLLNDHESARQ